MKRMRKVAAAAALAVGILASGMGTAHANTGSGAISPSHTGGCSAQYWWDSNGWFTQNMYVPSAPSCTSRFQFKIACGVYGVPGTYYWRSMRYEYFSSGYPANWLTTPTTNLCNQWGNDIVLDVALMEHDNAGGWNACYRLNRGYWIYTDGSLPCYPVADFSIQWGVG